MTRPREMVFAIAWVVAIGAASSPARAGIEDGLGLGPRAIGLGGSYAARPGDFAAVWYNPAGLTPGGRSVDRGGFAEVVVGFAFARPVLEVEGLEGSDPEVAAPVPDTVGLLLATRFSLGAVFGYDGLNAGLAVYLPASLFAWEIRPDDDVQWAFLTDRTQHIGIDVGLGWRPIDWLSVGAGLRVLFDVQTFTRGHVTEVESTTDPETGESQLLVGTQLGMDVTVFGQISPVFGVLVTPVDRLRIGAVVRAESFVDDWGDTQVSGVPGLGVLGYTHRFAHYYQPLEVTAAVSAAVSAGLELSVDLTWGRWSQALSTNRNTFGSGVFGDTLTSSVGASWRAFDGGEVLAGYRYVPSPLDNLGGPTNLLDNDRHVGSVGMALDLGELFSVPDLAMSLECGFQLVWLVEREEDKDWRRFESDEALEANPGYPGYRYGGLVPGLSIALEMGF